MLMKRGPQHKSSGITKGIIAVAVLIVLAGLALFFWKQSQPQPSYPDGGKKKDLVENIPSSSNNKSPNETKPYIPPTTSDTISLAAKEAGSNIVVSTKLFGYSDGTCTLVLKKGADTVQRSAPVMYQAEFSSCAGFSIPKTELSSGTWTVDLSVDSGGQTNSKQTTVDVT